MNERLYALISRRNPARALLVPCQWGWTLPEIPNPDSRQIPRAAEFNRRVLQTMGLEAITLNTTRIFEPAINSALNIALLEIMDTKWTPPAEGRWFDAADIATIEHSLPRQKIALATWCAETDDPSTRRIVLPWWKPGWFTKAANWMTGQIERLGYRTVGPVQQVKTAESGAVLRQRTSAGYLYFKASPPNLDRESGVMQLLAGKNQEHFPTILATDPKSHWMLMQDIGGQALAETDEIRHWLDTVRAYAQVQILSIPSMSSWRAYECPDLSLESIRSRIDPLVENANQPLAGSAQTLSSRRIAFMKAQSSFLKGLCEELMEFEIPTALEHGDFHAGNIRITAGRPVFYDWSHCVLTHPFFALGDLLLDDHWFTDVPGFADQVRDAYLEPWLQFGSRERLRAAYALSMRLYRLYRALLAIEILVSYDEDFMVNPYPRASPSGNLIESQQFRLAAQLRNLAESLQDDEEPEEKSDEPDL